MEWGSCMKSFGTKRGKKKQIWAISRSCTGTGIGLYGYRYRAVPVHPSRIQPVPVQVQPVPVHPSRMQPVPVQVRGVPV